MKLGRLGQWGGGAALGACLVCGGVAAAQAPPTSTGPALSGPVAASAARGAAAANDIRDIRGPLPIPSPWTWTLLGAGAALAAAGAYAVWRFRRRRVTSVATSPAEIALRRLVAARHLMESGEGRGFSIEISDAIRAYIESDCGVEATHLTTEEFLRDQLAGANPRLASHTDLLQEFLMQCDLAKFAGWQLAPASMEALYVNARRFVQQSAAANESSVASSSSGAGISPRHKEPYVSLPST